MDDRVVARHLQAMDREAKSKALKAIDFTLGLVKQLTQMGKHMPGANNDEVIKRLIEMRKAAQGGVKVEAILENKKLISGKGLQILDRLEKIESDLLPDEAVLADFVKKFPDKRVAAIGAQANMFRKIIANGLDTPEAEVDERLMMDREFMLQAFDLVTPLLVKVKASLDSAIGTKVEGEYQSRVKEGISAFGKQTRGGKSKPFIYFGDLVGCRAITPTVKSMAAACAGAQSTLDVLEKDNKFLDGSGYNAIHYALSRDHVMAEFQVKTTINNIEAAISHDLIYAEEKRIVDLPEADRRLVAYVIDVSTQLSMREWREQFDLAVRLASR